MAIHPYHRKATHRPNTPEPEHLDLRSAIQQAAEKPGIVVETSEKAPKQIICIRGTDITETEAKGKMPDAKDFHVTNQGEFGTIIIGTATRRHCALL